MRLRSVVLSAVATAGLGVGLGLAVGCAGPGAPAAAHAVATDFRATKVRGLDGGAVSLSSVLGGRPTLVSFWAPWCEPCLREQPELERLSRAVRACGGAVVGVAVGESPATVSAFAKDQGLTFAQFTDEGFELADAMGQRRIPATVIFDASARLVFTDGGLAATAIDALAALLPPGPDGARCALPAP
jgi:thiol-disulfide isomerase/thioredoxin